MKLTICGSMQHLAAMNHAKKQLEELGYEVETPNPSEREANFDSLSADEQATLKERLIREHLEKIRGSDAVLIYNEDKKGIEGYIGGNTLMEMAFAFMQGIEIFIFKSPTGVSYIEEILGMKPIAMNGNVGAIHDYFLSLPKAFVSSNSPVKLRAVSRGMRKAGIYVTVIPKPMESQVSEQPMSFEESYEGAENRHKALKEATASDNPTYLVTLESGLHEAHKNHNAFGHTVVILEKIGDSPKIGIDMDIEFPKEMTDKVPGIYPDIGVLVQEEFGSTLKDPYPYLTGGRITRAALAENAVFNVAAQLS